jgi:hypothetical protein
MAEIQTGDHFVDGDGHLWRVLRVRPDAVVLRGRGATAEFALVDGVIVSDREFCPATLLGGQCQHGFRDGRGCPDCDSDGDAFESHPLADGTDSPA